jgi:hypothetical protein
LVERFISLGLAQDQALLMDQLSKFNRLFFDMEAVKQELQKRPGDQRRALFPLYKHPNAQVRLKAPLRLSTCIPRQRPRSRTIFVAIAQSGGANRR